VASTALMAVVALLGPSVTVPPVMSAGSGPLFFVTAHPSATLIAGLMWIAVAVGAAGVAAGLVAVNRGWRPRPRVLVAASLIGVITLMVLPPIGSTDLVDDAIYGRIAALGHSPYTMTPRQLRHSDDPVANYAPRRWRRLASLYGPLTTFTQAVASRLGGDSASRTMFWLKVWNALAFLAVALALDRFCRSDKGRRVRAHLLWTANPLMLLAVMAGGHNDVLGVVFGLLAVFALRRLDLRHGLVAGILIGLAVTVKAPFALFGLGLALATLRSPRALAGLVVGTAVVAVPGYAVAGGRAVAAVVRESSRVSSFAQPWQLAADLVPHLSHGRATEALALLASIALAGLLLWRMPAGPAQLPAVRPVLALTLAWLVWSPVQRAWYDVLLFPLVALMPATRLDWLVLGRALLGAIGQLPGDIIPNKVQPVDLVAFQRLVSFYLIPLALLGVALVLAWLCLNRQLDPDEDKSPPLAVPA
jgi:hypothetical protein